MNKTQLLLVLFGFLFLTSFAQQPPKVIYDFSIETSDPYPVVDGDKYYFAKGDELFALKKGGRTLFLQKYTTYPELKHVKTIQVEGFETSFAIEAVKEINDKFYMFYSIYDRPNETEQLFVVEIDFQDLTLSNHRPRLIAVDGKIDGTFFAMMGIGVFKFGVFDKFYVHHSFDNSKIVVQYLKKLDERRLSNRYSEIGMYVFDNELNELWHKEVTMPHSERQMEVLDYAVDNQGNGYILTLVYKDESRRKFVRGEVNHHIEMIKIENQTGKVTSTEIDLKDKGISSIALYENGQEYMTCAGFYSTNKKTADVEGLFVFKLSKDGKIIDEVTHPIPLSVTNAYVSKKQANRNTRRGEKDESNINLENLKMRDLFFLSDGSVVITAEQYFTRTTYSSKGRSTTRYYYNNMLISKIGATGNLDWIHSLGKRQVGSRGRGAMSFEYIFADNAHYLYFLDNVKNLELPTDREPHRHSDGHGGFLTAYRVDNDSGKVNKVSILDTRNVKKNKNDKKGIGIHQFYPDKVVKINDKEFVFETYIKNKQDMLIKMYLE
jgi:hypothetical protein